jgi:hypothetical protein
MSKKKRQSADLIPPEIIEKRIYIIRSHKVMLDSDLAELYGVETRALVQGVKRNLDRFPEDFMFQLTPKELELWRSQIVISNPAARMALRRPPYAFTEQGVAMLSSVLRSDRAVKVNIAIMRAFARLRELLALHKDLARQIEALERKDAEHDARFRIVLESIRELAVETPKPKRRIGFKPGNG